MIMTKPGCNVARHLAAMARTQPDRPAVICAAGAGYVQYTFRELHEVSDRLAHGLTHIGIRRGMRTVLMVPPSLEFFAMTFALFKVGAVTVLIDPGIGVRNLGICLGEAAPEAFIGVTKAHAARVILGWARKTVRIPLTVGRRIFWGGWTSDQLLSQTSDPYPMVEPNEDETAAILFTSGSTGVSKGAVYTHGIFAAQVEYLQGAFAIRPGEVDLATFPLFALFDPALGMTAVIPDMNASRPGAADPAKLLRAIDDHGVTQMFGSPALLDRLSRHAERDGITIGSLRRVLSAGAPVRVDILERMTRVLPPDAEIQTPYGATEALPVSVISNREILGDTSLETARGGGICVGRPVPQVEVFVIRISDDPIERWSDGLIASPGEIGEIVVRGPIVTREYYGRPESTRLAKIASADGGGIYHRMGDLGRIDAKGRLWFCGRKSHRVVTPGGTLYTIPCEAIFNQHPSVFRTALVGIMNDGVRIPVLCVELEPELRNPNRKQIESELLVLGAQHPHTQSIRTILFHSGFPVDIRHNAKIAREKLAIWAEKQPR